MYHHSGEGRPGTATDGGTLLQTHGVRNRACINVVDSNLLVYYCFAELTAVIAGTKTPPSRDSAHCPIGGTLWWECSGAHVAVESGRLTQFDQHDIAVLCSWVVVRVANELGRHDELFRPLSLPDVVLAQPYFYIGPGRIKPILRCIYAQSVKTYPDGRFTTYFVLQCAAESTHSLDRRTPPQKLYPVKRDTWWGWEFLTHSYPPTILSSSPRATTGVRN